jgi:hypothetical protein
MGEVHVISAVDAQYGSHAFQQLSALLRAEVRILTKIPGFTRI